jgi:hypothetical protein
MIAAVQGAPDHAREETASIVDVQMREDIAPLQKAEPFVGMGCRGKRALHSGEMPVKKPTATRTMVNQSRAGMLNPSCGAARETNHMNNAMANTITGGGTFDSRKDIPGILPEQASQPEFIGHYLVFVCLHSWTIRV